MTDIIGSVASEMSLWLLVGAMTAGVVRGFSGFGTAMIYLPVAGTQMSPVAALTTLAVMDLVGPLMLAPRIVRNADVGDVMRLSAGALAMLPLGVFLLLLMAAEVFRYAVSSITLVLLALLISGIRYEGSLSRPLVYGAGGIGGLFAGSVGLPGPPVIMLYLASSLPVVAVRANLFIYLIVADIMLLGVLAFNGQLHVAHVALGLAIALPFVAAMGIGSLIFRPEKERVYRFVAYGIIATSAVLGLPVLN
ncbi:MAG: sulfite exporter TauE/SafE family protein [Rhodobacteraceae bacterium]|nr:sulfite exporter TauE/SafE family protein [Paracoccaceae bacterium]